MQPVLSMRGVTKSFARGLARASRRTQAIVDLSLDVFPGDVILLTGDEGAGKTTLLQCASSILRLDEGEVHRASVRYVPAVPVYYPFLTVRDVMGSRDGRHSLADSILSDLDLRAFADGVVANLSSTALKRLAVAEALMSHPGVVLIDTSGFEVPSCATVSAAAATGAAVVVAARNGSSLAQISTRIVCLAEGRISRSFTTGHSLVAERMH